ncbi:MAG: hypothetical protein KF819_29450 [Labilithrix sp.]|nr:hypothetical protein [Labilithrix sp.]
MKDLVLDAARSRVRLQTFAEGLFARLAHDLELSCGELSGTGRGEGATAGSADIDAPLRAVTVTGVLRKDGSIDAGGLSPSDRNDCLAKMRSDVFHDRGDGVVRVEARVEAGAARVRVVPPNGKAVEVTTRPDVRAEGDAIRASGKLEISLSAIGSDVVKGPMGAFRVKDVVTVVYDVVFVPKG